MQYFDSCAYGMHRFLMLPITFPKSRSSSLKVQFLHADGADSQKHHALCKEKSKWLASFSRGSSPMLGSSMDYDIRRSKSELDSTGYMEIGPGKYAGKHWQDGFLFIWEDAFSMAEGIIAKHLPDYDHFGMNDIPKEIGNAIVSEWEECAGVLCDLSTEQAQIRLNLSVPYRENLEKEISAHCAEIAMMLKELSSACRSYYKNEGHVCVLGM